MIKDFEVNRIRKKRQEAEKMVLEVLAGLTLVGIGIWEVLAGMPGRRMRSIFCFDDNRKILYADAWGWC